MQVKYHIHNETKMKFYLVPSCIYTLSIYSIKKRLKIRIKGERQTPDGYICLNGLFPNPPGSINNHKDRNKKYIDRRFASMKQ